MLGDKTKKLKQEITEILKYGSKPIDNADEARQQVISAYQTILYILAENIEVTEETLVAYLSLRYGLTEKTATKRIFYMQKQGFITIRDRYFYELTEEGCKILGIDYKQYIEQQHLKPLQNNPYTKKWVKTEQ